MTPPITVIESTHPARAGKTGKGVLVATIDSGVTDGHPHVGSVHSGVAITSNGCYEADYVDQLGHGTAVAAAIREKAPGATLCTVRVFHDELRANAEQIARGIDWAARQGAGLINLSLGTANADHADLLADAVNRAATRGTLVVSAYEHHGVRWLPGCLDNTVPVVLDGACERMALNVRHRGERTVLGASGQPRPIPGVPRERNFHGISFAVANATGVIAGMLEGFDRPASAPAIFAMLLQHEG